MRVVTAKVSEISAQVAGKKLCAINVILETSMIHPVIDKLLLAPDKKI
jgi:hypothetical protein